MTVKHKNPDAATAYNTAHPTTWARAWRTDPPGGALGGEWAALIEAFRAKARLGEPAPEFSGELLHGGTFSLADHRFQRSVLIVFGSLACPPCVTNISTTHPNLAGLYRDYAPQGVEFVYVYTREAHPGAIVGPHGSMDEKRANARRLAEMEGITFPLVVDNLRGDIHKQYCTVEFNNSAFLVNRAGAIVYKSAWLDSSELPQVLDDTLAWDREAAAAKVIKKSYSERIRMLREPLEPDCIDKMYRLFDLVGISLERMGAVPGQSHDD